MQTAKRINYSSVIQSSQDKSIINSGSHAQLQESASVMWETEVQPC